MVVDLDTTKNIVKNRKYIHSSPVSDPIMLRRLVNSLNDGVSKQKICILLAKPYQVQLKSHLAAAQVADSCRPPDTRKVRGNCEA